MADVRLIDANALITDYRICGGCSAFTECNGIMFMCDSTRVRQAINEASTIEAEPVKNGKWESIGGLEEQWLQGFACSECNQITTYKCNFCPSCGADMRSDEDGNCV